MSELNDPVNSTDRSLGRGAFIGLSAGAAAGTGTIARALADATALGRPHAPIVAEDDPAIRVQFVPLSRPDGPIAAYAAAPRNAGPATPGLVVVMHIWGVDTSIRDVVRRYAKEGFATIAPDLYQRFHSPDGDGVSDISVFRPFAKQLVRAQYDGDLTAGAEWLVTNHPQAKIGIIGFCMGGTFVLQQAIDNGMRYAAAAPFYGAVKDIDPARITMPICGNYGERDTSIPADDVRAFAKALRVPNDIRVYAEAGHAFFDDQRGAYVATAASDSWKHTLAFFRKYLAAS
jgi:carboxymethylenebutenolidase